MKNVAIAKSIVERVPGHPKMKVALTFSEKRPKFSVLGFEGNLLFLSARTTIVISEDQNIDPLSHAYSFYFEKNVWARWKLCVNPGIKLQPESKELQVLTAILSTANDAIKRKSPVDLSGLLNQLDQIDPFNFVGLFDEIDLHFYEPIYSDYAQKKLDEMREWMKANLDRVEADEHLLAWLGLLSKPTIWVDESNDK